MDEQTKSCTECNTVLPLIDFPIRSDQADGHHWWCFTCKRAKDRKYGESYRAAHPEEVQRNGRKYARKDAVRAARSAKTMKEKYGLTPEAFAAKLEAQGGHCPFCPPGEVPKLWDIDHDHRCCPGPWSCGRCLRDILCHRHNQGLGFWDDDPAQLRAAADYIERHRERISLITDPPRAKAAKSGEGHQGWKGDTALPASMQQRVYRAKGSASACANRETASCASERYEWVLIPGADPGKMESYVSLCAACRIAVHGNHGGGHPRARLTSEQADEIRLRKTAGGITQTALAAEYGVSVATISEIVRGVSYRTAVTQ